MLPSGAGRGGLRRADEPRVLRRHQRPDLQGQLPPRRADKAAAAGHGADGGEADRVDGAVPVRNGGLSVEKTIKFGVIGCGLMGREFASASMRWLHLQTDLPRPQIIAACSRTDKSLDWFRRVPDTRYFYHDYHELLENPEVEEISESKPSLACASLSPSIRTMTGLRAEAQCPISKLITRCTDGLREI